MKKIQLIGFITVFTLLFCVAIAFDLSPYLRGPAYYPPEWRWEYLFENTLQKIYAPLLCILSIGVIYWVVEKKKKLTGRQLFIFIAALVLLFFSLQFAVLYFSRSGIGVLIHRIINPEINGYFTAALSINSVPEFLRMYNDIMLDFVYHAKAHPPGAILLFYYLHQLTAAFPLLGEWAAQQMPGRPDVKVVWDTLSSSGKASVFVSALFIPFLSTLSLIPLYYTAKLLYSDKAALRSLFLFIVIPSVLFFIPINDAFLHIFSLTAFCFFAYGLKKNNYWFLASAGVTMFLGSLFNLSLLPVLVLFFVYFIVLEFTTSKKHLGRVFKRGLVFLLGLITPFFLLFAAFGFNFIEMTLTIMKHVPDVHTRSYTIWIFYNLYDFFVFTGIPVALLYFSLLAETVKSVIRKNIKRIDPLLIAFTTMILILNFSGSNRGETGRIWIPYVPFIILIVSGFLTNTLKLSSKAFALILGLQALQILVMQEFWVMLW